VWNENKRQYFQPFIGGNVERVEVLKGPSSACIFIRSRWKYQSCYKKPLAIDRKEVSLSAGSFSTFHLEA
jgi:iron complex outermembrane receptor protein